MISFFNHIHDSSLICFPWYFSRTIVKPGIFGVKTECCMDSVSKEPQMKWLVVCLSGGCSCQYFLSAGKTKVKSKAQSYGRLNAVAVCSVGVECLYLPSSQLQSCGYLLGVSCQIEIGSNFVLHVDRNPSLQFS